ncbi:DnaJ-like protein (chromatophore) [Paulinella micropora]|uniref:DnaJ protein n=1 Tax=Paulinella micropora TaxID=1928728 RepID=A0A1S6YHE7_9EUKA|nr:DnaJ protein [Paulinella micropora]BBL85952.1 DnaJ-like protein [Paulinella micropora]
MSHYELLKVKPTASVQDLRQAFRTLSKQYHPDTTELPSSEAAVQFQELQQAYAILINPERRKIYDAELELNKERTSKKTITLSKVESHRRPFSGGEWFAIILLCFSMMGCLVLGLVLVWIRGDQGTWMPVWLEQSYAMELQLRN